MICKKYDAQYKISKVKEYLEETQKTNISKAMFAYQNGISDSTFNDWVIKYQRDNIGFCNITNELVKLENTEVVNTEQYLIKKIDSQANDTNNYIIKEDYLRLYYNGAVIEFNKAILDKVMGIVKEW